MTSHLPRGWLELRDDPTNDHTAFDARFHLRRNCSRIENPDSIVRGPLPWSARHCPHCAGELESMGGFSPRREIPGRVVFVVGLAMVWGCVAVLIILGIGY